MLRILLVIILALNVSISNAQVPVQVINYPSGFLFGVDVAISEDGSQLAIINGGQFGQSSVHIYQLVAGNYEFEQILEFQSEVTDLSFSDDNQTLIVGEGLGNIFRTAYVYFFQKISGEWIKLQAQINDPATPSDGTGDSFDVSLDGSTIVLGIRTLNDGEVYIYQFNEDGSIEQKGSKLVASSSEQFFGNRVGVSGDGNRLSISCNTPNYTKIFDFENGDWVEKETIQNYKGYTSLSRDGNTALFSQGNEIAIYTRNTDDTWSIQGAPIVANTEVNQGWNIRDVAFFPESKSISISMLNAFSQETKIATFDNKGGNWIERRNPFYDKVYDDYTGVDVSTTADASLLILPSARSMDNQGEVFVYNDLANASLGVAAFLDKNGNGTKEEDEQYFTDCRFIIDGETTLFAQEGYSYASVHGIEHSAVVVPNNEGMVSTNDSIASISYTTQDDRFILFGLYYENPTVTGTIHSTNQLMLCNTTDKNYISIRNTGTEEFTATITLSYDDVSFVGSSLEPLTTSDSTIEWETDVILPGEWLSINSDFEMPDETFTNNIIPFKVSVSLFQEGFPEPAVEKDIDISFTLRCSYDPNDKTVYPAGIGEDNLTLIDQDLTYRIRFQNTGNFPAQHVVVEDEISEDLDLRTLELIETSHPLTQMSQNDRNIKFTFENIMLADSVSNEPESHGYIYYSIRPNADIAENTIVENTANIFFDLNAEITTNTTLSTMVTSFPTGTSTSDLLNSINFDIYPNPASDEVVIPDNLKDGDLKIFDVNGKLIDHILNVNSKVDISPLAARDIYIVIIEKDGQFYSSQLIKG